MSKLGRRLLIIILFFLSISSFSQKEDKVALTDVLQQIETRFSVKFSFADKTVKHITLIPPKSELSLDNTILYLEQQTGLFFNTLSDRFIAIELKTNADNEQELVLQKLDEVIVENYLTKGLSKSVDGNISLTPEKFDILPGLIEPDVLQAIQALPGILSADERISNINIRGSTNDQNLILFEGIKMYQSGHFFGLISAFNPYLSKQIDISKNGTKVKYGDGISSIISITNSDDIDNQFKAGAGANLISVDGFAKIPTSKNTELQLSARRSYTDVLLSPTYDAYFERIFRETELNLSNSNTIRSQDERFYFYDLNAKFLYDINSTSKLRVNFINIFNSLNYDQEFINNADTLERNSNELDQMSLATSIVYTKDWGNNLITSAQVSFSNYDINAVNNNVTSGQQLTQENKVEDIGVRLDLNKRLDKNLNLNTGYQFNEVGVTNLEDVVNPVFRSLVKEIIRTHVLYGEAEFTSLSKNTYTRIGLRANYIEKFGEILTEPRLAFSQKFLDHFRLELLAEVKNQTIAQIIDLQQDFFGIEKRRWQLSNDESIPIIKSQQFSLGINYSNRGWLINAEAYTKNVEGITARSQGFQNQFQFIEDTGKYNVKGIDLLVNKQFKQFSTWLSYSYSNNDYTFKVINDGITFPNNIDITHTATFASTYAIDKLKIGIGINWHSGRPYTTPSENQDTTNNQIEYDSPNNKRLDDYIRADISAIYKFNLSKKIKAEVGASIWNIFNKKNIINRFYTQDANDTIIQVDNQSLEFTPNLSFRVNF